MANSFTLTAVFLVMAGLVAAFIVYSLKKGASGLKIMLLGISIMLFGGIIAVDPNSELGGIEYLIVLSGLLISLVGFVKKD